MLEYTVLVIIFLVFDLILDYFLGTNLYLQKKFWILISLVILLQTIFDNWLNGRWFFDSFIVGPYGQRFYSGVVVWNTPLENYFYGIGLIWMCIIVFEYFKKNMEIYNK